MLRREPARRHSLQHIADAVVRNHPEMKLIILLVDERPEEVTEIRRTVPKADIMASSNDSDIKSHTRIAQLAIERAKRLVEAGKDVFVLMDSLTRVGRAFNNAISGSGRTMSGGMDSRAMEIPRKLFAAARNTEEAGSLTIMATALIETGSKMDELIFQEFKGTGNMEMVLDRQISDQRIYPAIDIFKSGTRREKSYCCRRTIWRRSTRSDADWLGIGHQRRSKGCCLSSKNSRQILRCCGRFQDKERCPSLDRILRGGCRFH